MRGATSKPDRQQKQQDDFNPRTPCGVRREKAARQAKHLHFNPRTPCGVRQRRCKLRTANGAFQSTHPMRGATQRHIVLCRRNSNFNPRTPCGVRLCGRGASRAAGLISIHAPHAGCDMGVDVTPVKIYISIHAPHAGCDNLSGIVEISFFISIHAPHAGCDRINGSAQSSPSGFQSTHPMRGATKWRSRHSNNLLFQSTHPMRGATTAVPAPVRRRRHFNPRTPCGVRRENSHNEIILKIFQSTHPMRGATGCHRSPNRRPCYFNPRTPCGVRQTGKALTPAEEKISIHAPLAGCDTGAPNFKGGLDISIHAPHAGCDYLLLCLYLLYYISIHAPHAGCDTTMDGAKARFIISIHAPHAGCDRLTTCSTRSPRRFQSTHPMRGATPRGHGQACGGVDFNPRTPCGVRLNVLMKVLEPILISIHAPHAGCDGRRRARLCAQRDFNPRTPCGVRLNGIINAINAITFQSTHPMRGATISLFNQMNDASISIHAPHAGCDGERRGGQFVRLYFNPRTPCGVRHSFFFHFQHF